MRLVCPNCDAKYEVPDDAIPESGRDVQCANCNHAWFQMKPGSAPEPAREPLIRDDAPMHEPDVSLADEGIMAASAAQTATSAKGYGVDDSVLAILREEAEREAQARRNDVRSDPTVIETQTDLGLDTIVPAAAPKREADAHVEPSMEEATRPSARRDLLPDVEEINSTLRPSERPIDPDAEIAALPDLNAGRNSFRSGFLIMVALAVVALVAYLAAPQLAQQLPALEGPLKAYVSFVDTLRLQLDGLMQAATSAMNGG